MHGCLFLQTFFDFSYDGFGICAQYLSSTRVPFLIGCGLSNDFGYSLMQTASLNRKPVPQVAEHCFDTFEQEES